MSFNSITFAVFLVAVFLIYWSVPPKHRWILLLVSSYYFYMSWNTIYIFLIFFTTVISYLCGRLLAGTQSKNKKKAILFCSASVSLGILFLFKYFNFFADIFFMGARLFSLPVHPVTLSLLLPVGISFYTFQTLSYVIDVYYGKAEAEKHFGKYAVFIAFFPQLVAGPIERTENLLPQIKEEHVFRYEDAVYGLRQMLWGFFKKIVIADTLSYHVDFIYDTPFSYRGGVFLIATFFFSIQIYCDFSGYSDIAIGTARLFGIRLMENFRSPYLSKSVHEFWRRWHIPLSSWFRDYVYIPLGGNRRGHIRKQLNTLLTFLLSGLWHGADVTFVFWGGIHGFGQIAENTFLRKRSRRFSWLSRLAVLLFVTFAWIFFRANTLQEASYIIRMMFWGISNPVRYLWDGLTGIGIRPGMRTITYLKIGVPLLALFIVDWISRDRDLFSEVSKCPKAVRLGIYYLMGFVLIFYCFQNIGENQFVYFQF